MRISDWSSDVCSSDLYWESRYREADQAMDPKLCKHMSAEAIIGLCVEIVFSAARQDRGFWRLIERQRIVNPLVCNLLIEWNAHFRSEARSVGKEGVSTCRSWWSPYH